ncbi:Pirin [Halomonas citrativorans]|uniref:Pirin n=1 Tax=Halomonas citrativorans TaxID=2742612 RepID=A0A1R4I2J0_9GAMM|nr:MULTISPECIES: pirin family protein [Halomonas]SJN14081.1 Pirin [Halomonas citrativorans]|tara:strand:+ start:3297 stop:4034 length:738 start_codon:yes stop_codon:yes gene_type:complete
MRVNAALQQIRRGNHFQANALRGGNELISPFLGVDHAWMSAPTFPEHSHAGLSAVTYVFMDAKTGYDNRDSLGTRNLIRPGGLHWTTAGRGIRHEEIPAEPGKTAHSLQIFVDLAVDMRDMEPFALSLEPDEVPAIRLPGVDIRVPLGCFADVCSPLCPPTSVTMLDITMGEGSKLVLPVAAGHNAFVMAVDGTIQVDDQAFKHDDAELPIFPAQNKPHEITIHSINNHSRAVFFSGQPLHTVVN